MIVVPAIFAGRVSANLGDTAVVAAATMCLAFGLIGKNWRWPMVMAAGLIGLYLFHTPARLQWHAAAGISRDFGSDFMMAVATRSTIVFVLFYLGKGSRWICEKMERDPTRGERKER